jgi:SAM-dependent methyltransferase
MVSCQENWNADLKKLFHTKHTSFYQGKIEAIKFREKIACKHLPKGYGVELGALYWPTPLTNAHQVVYADFRFEDESQVFYGDKAPEKNLSPGMVDVDVLVSGSSFAGDIPSGLDFFIANHVFEHVPFPQQFLMDLAKVLRTDGVALLSVPDASKIFDKARNRTNVADFVHAIDSKRFEHVVFVEGIRNYGEAEKRVHEIKVNREDPHLWVFDTNNLSKVLLDAFELWSIPLEIIETTYNEPFEEINVFLRKL